MLIKAEMIKLMTEQPFYKKTKLMTEQPFYKKTI